MIYKSPATTFVTVSDGAPATSYSVVPSVTTMTRNVSNTVLSPASVTFSAYAKTGEAAQEAYTGYLYAECSYDGGGTWSAVSGAAASSQTCAPEILSNGKQLTGIRASLYTDAEMGTLLARVSVSVVLDDAAVQVLLCEENGEVRVNGANLAAGSVAARSIDVEDLFAQDITASGTISGLKLRGETIDIEASATDAGSVRIASSRNEDGSYNIELYNASGGTGMGGKAYLQVRTDVIYFSGSQMVVNTDELVLSGVPVVADCTHNTYTLFDSSVVEEGSVTVVKKLGWCQVYGYVKLADTVSAMMDILDSTKVPAPQTGVGIYDTAGYWTSSYTRLMRVGVGAGGGLRIMYGAAGTFWFSITYPVA